MAGDKDESLEDESQEDDPLESEEGAKLKKGGASAKSGKMTEVQRLNVPKDNEGVEEDNEEESEVMKKILKKVPGISTASPKLDAIARLLRIIKASTC